MTQCQICLRADRKLVRDHDHATGFSRGRLCNPCNGWLGLLERHPESYYLRKKPGDGSWRKWVYENSERIYAYLSQPPSGVWHSEGVRRKKQAMNSKVSGPIVRVAKGAIGNLTINGMRDRAGKHFARMPVVKSFHGVRGCAPAIFPDGLKAFRGKGF